MIKKLLLLTAVLVVAAASPAAAGGWATSALEDPPAQLVAGQDLAVGFTIRQHGQTPVNPDSGDVGIRLANASTGEGLTFLATQQGPVGHYVATVNVPTPGAWSWEVLQGWFEPQPLGPIDVVATPAAAAIAGGASSGGGVDGWRIAAVVVAALLLVAFVAELVLGRRRSRKPVAAVGA